jgi:DNA repair protein RadD|tara:strand:- start:3077 stop:4924 length:1848 start_codon:yes stop_codon:yes gene_type:complete
MTFRLRPYQQSACEAALAELKISLEPILIDAAPAAGKSFMIARLAHALHDMSGGKRVLCLAPSRELVTQNHQKYLLTGERASIFSASAGTKSTRQFVVFGTPGTVKNSISRFQRDYCAVIVDECHGITPTIRAIIEAMREANPNLRVIGLTGTPFLMNTGYIFRVWPDGKANGDDVTRDPYFLKCVYRVSAREMLDEGFITPMTIGAINSEAYETGNIRLLPNGTFNSEDVERAFEGHGRKTAAAVADVIAQARNRPGGVMYFAATVKHAHEVLASLPPENSALVTGATPTAERNRIIKAYRNRTIRHLVNVGTLTTGFDVEHTETIALLRFTESAALLQQILGRAWRLHPDKADSLLLDYAGNVAKHFPDGDIYNPEIRVKGKGGEGIPIEAECPDCGYVNEFSLNPEYADYQRDKHGYALDVFGEPIVTEHGPLSTHYGRRCLGVVPSGVERGKFDRCGYRWNGKDCPACGAQNDIAARYCVECEAEIVNPNDKIIADFKAMKKDPTQPQTDRVLTVDVRESMSQRGNETIRLDFVTPYRQFSVWMLKEPKNSKQASDLAKWQECGGSPETVSYVKDADSQFFRVLAYNRPADDEDAPEFVLAETEKLRRNAA